MYPFEASLVVGYNMRFSDVSFTSDPKFSLESVEQNSKSTIDQYELNNPLN